MNTPAWLKVDAVVVYSPTGEDVTVQSQTDTGWTVQPATGDPIDCAPSDLAFKEYDVAGVGTVIDPEDEPGYRIRLPDGQVTAYRAASGEPSQANAEADIAAAISNPPPLAQSQDVRVILSRLTNAETAAIFGSTDPIVMRFRSMALAVGHVDSSDPDAQAGFAYLVSNGFLASNRPDELLAP